MDHSGGTRVQAVMQNVYPEKTMAHTLKDRDHAVRGISSVATFRDECLRFHAKMQTRNRFTQFHKVPQFSPCFYHGEQLGVANGVWLFLCWR